MRKHMGYTHIAAPHAAAIEDFYEEHLNPYLNFHRPCGVPELVVNAKGKTKRGMMPVRLPRARSNAKANGPSFTESPEAQSAWCVE